MKCLAIPLVALAASTAYGQSAERKLIYFDYAKADLTPKADSTLGTLGPATRLAAVEAVTISGHTDADGNTQYNQQLSKARAERVRQYFRQAGVAASKIKVLHFGEEKPFASNLTEDGKQDNRRVEIIVRYKNNLPLPGKPNRNTARLPGIPRELVQTFTVSPQKEMIIRGRQGTLVKFPENSFVTAQGVVVTSDLTIELVEVFTKPDMLLASLTTTSDQQPLETSGMIHLRARAGTEELTLKPEAFYRVEFLITNKRKDVDIFYGEANITGLNWKKAPNNWRSDFTYEDDRKTLDRYVFNSSRLGWINCDRFLNRTPVTDLLVTASDTTDVSFCLVFKSFNSVLGVSSRRNKISFSNIPVGEVAAVIAFKKTPQSIYYASQKITTQPNQAVALRLEKLTEGEFKARISTFQ